MQTQSAWFAVHSNARQEATAAYRLAALGLEVFFPREWRMVRHARRTVSELRPHISRYLFARAEARWFRAINTTVGVSCLVSIAGNPVPIPERFMVDFRAGYAEDGVWIKPPPKPKPPPFSIGEWVSVVEGPFASFPSVVERVDANGHLRILVSVFGRATPVDIVAEWVRSLSPDRSETARNLHRLPAPASPRRALAVR